MIPPNPEELQIITNPNDIPQVETTGFYVSVRASYLGRTWELRVNTKSTVATLGIVTRIESSNNEVLSVIRHITESIPPVEVVGLAGLSNHLQNLITRYSHKGFVLEGEAKDAI